MAKASNNSGLPGGFLHLPGSSTSVVAKVHPVVLFNICDSYIRRNEGQERVIGTLLGTVNDNGMVEIKNSYTVPHNENMDQVAVDIEFHKTMFDLHQRVNPKEVIVGWYSTGSQLMGSDALIQDFYGREVTNPVHLKLDTVLEDNESLKPLQAYVSTPLSLGERQLGCQFYQVPVEMRMVEAERVGVDILQKSMVEKLPTDMQGLESTMTRLKQLVSTAFQYVDDVCEGRKAADNSIGRYLSDTIAALPRLSPEDFENLFNESVQDVLLVRYLADLTRTQLALAEKLNTQAMPGGGDGRM